jgi:P-type Cu2+ transporter
MKHGEHGEERGKELPQARSGLRLPIAFHNGHPSRDKRDTERHTSHHARMVASFQKRFWLSPAITVPILALTPMIQEFFGIREAISFTEDGYLLFALSTIAFFYGGWPFLKALPKSCVPDRPA